MDVEAGTHRMIDPRLLLPFVVLTEELHFGRAARRLHLTQSALSQQIQRLEKQVGVGLVERDSRRVVISPAGQVFLTGARDALETMVGAVREAQRAGRGQTTVRIGVDIELPDTLIRRLRLFGATRPDLVVRWRIQQQDDVVVDLELGRSDLAIGWTSRPMGASSLAHIGLTTVDIHGVFRRDDAVATDTSVHRSRLADHRLVTYRPSRDTRAFYDFFLQQFIAPDGSRPDVTHVPVLDDAQAAMLDAVEQTGGFTFCVAGNVERLARPLLTALPFEPPITTDVVAMWRGSTPPPVLADIATFVRDGNQPG